MKPDREVRFDTPWGPAVVWVGRTTSEGSLTPRTLFASDNLCILTAGPTGRMAYVAFDNPVPRAEALDWCDTFLRTRAQH